MESSLVLIKSAVSIVDFGFLLDFEELQMMKSLNEDILMRLIQKIKTNFFEVTRTPLKYCTMEDALSIPSKIETAFSVHGIVFREYEFWRPSTMLLIARL